MLFIAELNGHIMKTFLVSEDFSITEEVTLFYESESVLGDSLHAVFKGRHHFFGSTSFFWVREAKVYDLTV